jgi:GNAT superfamily N-acetyltransferase
MNHPPLTPRPSAGPEVPRWTETLRDRHQVLIRPIRPQDGPAEAAFIEGLSLQARRFRFLGQVASPSEALVERLTDIDWVHDAAFVAVVHEDGRERIVGVARYASDADGARCECAVTVAEGWEEKGLGTALMQHLIEVARARGIRTMVAVVSADNLRMRELAGHLGFVAGHDPAAPDLVIYRMALQPTATTPL